MALKNKLLSNIICLALMVSSYMLEPQDMSIDLKETMPRVVKIAKLLGCRFQAPSGEKKRKRSKLLVLTLA